MRAAMTAVAVLGLGLPRCSEPDPIAVGLMQRYNPGIMADSVAVQVNKGLVSPGTDPFMAIALTDCARVGSVVWRTMPNGITTGPHTVVDCSQPWDLERHLEKGLAVEVSYAFADRYSIPINAGRYRLPMDGPLDGVIVWETNPHEIWRCWLGWLCPN